jgi:hypothetical protein
MKITRKQVLEAIRTEKLKPDHFVHGEYDSANSVTVFSPGCKVCAVGAVLRQAGVSNEDMDYRAYSLIGGGNYCSGDDEYVELANKNYLAALSIKFENLAKKNGGAGPKTKASLRNFVRRHFPKVFETVGQ